KRRSKSRTARTSSAVLLRPWAVGAGEGNRTLVISLEGCCSTIELHPHQGPPDGYLIPLPAHLHVLGQDSAMTPMTATRAVLLPRPGGRRKGESPGSAGASR